MVKGLSNKKIVISMKKAESKILQMKNFRLKLFFLILAFSAFLLLSGCATEYMNKNPVGELFPSISGQSLDEKPYLIPRDLGGKKTLLLIGYRQNAQFDIDRWMMGMDMQGIHIPMIELPAIQSFLAGLFKGKIDEGMRAGIPRELWPVVVTTYEDGKRVQNFTGNERPNNARVVLLNKTGRVVYFYDRGFSVQALNKLHKAIQRPECGDKSKTQTLSSRLEF